jgi:hypothetical protein
MLRPADDTSPHRAARDLLVARPDTAPDRDPPGVSEALRLMDEAALADVAELPDAVTYRLVLMPSFEPDVGIRVERRAERYHISVKVLARRNRVTPTKLVFREERPLDAFDWRALERLIFDAHFWRKPRQVARTGLDGTMWVLEGARYGFYHAVARWSPDPHGDDAGFLAACDFLLHLASPPELWRRR